MWWFGGFPFSFLFLSFLLYSVVLYAREFSCAYVVLFAEQVKIRGSINGILMLFIIIMMNYDAVCIFQDVRRAVNVLNVFTCIQQISTQCDTV